MTHFAGAKRLVVLISGAGSNLAAIIEAIDTGALEAEILGVISDRPGVKGLEIAQKAQIPQAVFSLKNYETRAQWDQALRLQLENWQPDLVVCAGFLKILGPEVLQAFPGRIINTHNSLLPAFPGIDGPAQALAAGVKITGATLFLVDPGMDTGAILAQVAVQIQSEDNLETLSEKIKIAERRQLVGVLKQMCSTGWWEENGRAGI